MRTIALVIILSMSSIVRADQYEIFTLVGVDSDREDVTIYQVNQGDQILDSINQKLFEDGVLSEEQGKQYVTTELTDALSNQIKGLVKAARYQLTYFPAVVVNGRYVIYGTTEPEDYLKVKP